MSQGKKQSVLLIEPDASLRRLITLGLQHRGIQVIEASSPASILTIDAQQFNLLVLDIDNGVSSDWSLLAMAEAHPHFANLPKVVLAWECLLQESQSAVIPMETQITCLSKPFDARVLHDTVEQLLMVSAAREAAILARAEEALLASYAVHTAPSIWPVVTAAGLLLVFIGMMLQIALTVIGVLVVVVALLWWTLGTKPSRETMTVGVNS